MLADKSSLKVNMVPNNKISDRAGLTLAIACAVTIIVLIFTDFYYPYITEKYAFTLSIVIGLMTGIISAIALLYFQEKHYERKINLYYSEIAGHYKRMDI